jgi:hypothetical protein
MGQVLGIEGRKTRRGIKREELNELKEKLVADTRLKIAETLGDLRYKLTPLRFM